MGNAQNADRLLDAAAVADMLDVSREMVLLMCRDGRIPAIRIGNLWRFDREALAAWLLVNSTGPSCNGGIRC